MIQVNHQDLIMARDTLGKKIQNAVDLTGYGKFHYKLFLISTLVFMNTGFGVSSTGLIVPAVTCDFEMTTMDIGRLAAAPMLGMVCGSYFWGCLADVKGRRVALLASLFLDAIAGSISSFVPNFWVFAALRFLNGFAITGQSAMIFPYLGEFQPTHLREKILAWMEMAWTMGITTLPLLAWLIIPIEFRYTWQAFSFSSWNLFVFLCAMVPLSIGIGLSFFPESPKYLIEDDQQQKAIKVLSRMYAENTGSPPENYPIKFIMDGDGPIDEKIPTVTDGNIESQKIPKKPKKNVKKMITDIVEHTVTILKPPYLSKTLLTVIIQFSMTLSSYTMMSWFPEIFQRFAEFEDMYPHDSADVCTISTRLHNNETDLDFGCHTEIASSVYLFTIFLGLACIPTSIWLPLCIGKLGYKFFLVFSTVISGLICIGMLFVTSSLQNLLLSCIFEALTSMGISVIYCILVDFYPTKLRVIAASFSALCGRSGALLGNLMFGSLLDLDCIIPIVMVATLLISAGIFSLFLPGKEKNSTTDVTVAVVRKCDRKCIFIIDNWRKK